MNLRRIAFFLLIMASPIFSQNNSLTKKGDFIIGEKYHVLQYRANVRILPGRDNDVIAILSLHDEIEIIENTLLREQINEVWAYWYKIKYGNLIGYTFGGNLAREAFVTDMEGNSIKNYLYVRHRDMARSADYISTYIFVRTDLYFYINNQRINNNVFNRYYWDDISGHLIKAEDQTRPADKCFFEEKEGYLLIHIPYVIGGRDPDVFTSIYKLDISGRIEFYEWTFGENYSRALKRVFNDDLSAIWNRWPVIEPPPDPQEWNIKIIDGERWVALRRKK